MKRPLVSVVITTKNEEENIGPCLESIKLQTYPQDKIEIIVVDNYSTDKTQEIAQKYTNKVFSYGPERSAQRNFGMLEKARGKYLMYLDADMRLSKEVIEKAVAKLENSHLVALYIPEIVLGNSFLSRVRRFERSFYDGTVIDGLRFFKKKAFLEVGGFDKKLWTCEDWDLDKRMKTLGGFDVLERYDFEEIHKKIAAIDCQSPDFIEKLSVLTNQALIFHNEAKFILRNYFSKKAYYSQGVKIYTRKWGEGDLDIQRQFGFWYRFFGVFVENGKWKRLIRYPILTMGMYLLRVGVGTIYLLTKLSKK